MVDKESSYLKEIKQFLNQLENFINGIPGSVYWKDINGVYLGCNNVVIEKGNLSSKDDIIGKTDFDVWPERAEAIRKVDLEVMSLGQTIEVEETVILRNGDCLYFSSVKSPFTDEEGNIIGVIGNSLDVTELKQTKQTAEAASLAKTQFLALMSHELRLPLTGIITTANMLVENDMTREESRELGKIIEQSGNYLLTTVDSILDFAKLEANRFELNLSIVNLSQLIEEITSILHASMHEKNLKLNVIFHPAPPPEIITDARIIRHIVTNLLSNAIKYTEKGEITVRINNLLQSPHIVQLEIAIEDTGVGIPTNKLDYIFDRFSQIENTYTRKTSRGGTGLGLSIVKKLVNLLDSDVQVISQLGVGSKFFFVANFSLSQHKHNQEIRTYDESITRGG